MTENNINNDVIGKYFEIIQNVITRMAHNSFLIKAWSITLLASIIVLTLSIINILIIFVLLIVLSTFWILDSYYLRLEKLYRRLYDSKVEEFNDKSKRKIMKLFDMEYKKYEKDEKHTLRIVISKSELLFYLPLIIALLSILVYLLINP
ncbi:MAG: hypothetical protein JXA99_08925 [Candidatus Lokiarchaeota archaeon]|nr:hypothetical protein [Candidatus Lokiarchaeota archaeon]